MLVVIYKHSKQTDVEFLQYLKQSFKTLPKEKNKVILTGDFKVNLLTLDKNKEENEFLDLLTSNWFIPKFIGPNGFVEHN